MGLLRKKLRFDLSLKTLLPKGLFRRTLLIVGTPLVLVQIIFSVVFLDRHLDSVTRTMADNLTMAIKTIAEFYPNNKTDALLMADDWGFKVTVFSNQSLDSIKSGKFHAWEDRFLNRSLRVNVPFHYKMKSFPNHLEVFIQIDKEVLSLSFQRKRLMSRTTVLVLLWAFGASLLFLIIAMIFMKNQVRPLEQLAIATENFGKGLDGGKFKVYGATEVRRVAKAFNGMKERIRRQIDQRTEMLAGISHDLRTPLTRMKLELEMLPDSEAVGNLKNDVHQMEFLVNEYLAFVKGSYTEQPEPASIAELIQEVVDGFKKEALKISCDIPHDFVMPIRKMAFKRALQNLLSNANRYAKKVFIKIYERHQNLWIVIDDDGQGIPTKKRQEVFRPFFRLEGSRNTKTGGVGLGLSITQDVIHHHGGKIDLGTSPQGGLRVVIKLPL
ncbi:MAG: ATP-binding protein [Alphaproteobacteria bacterium]